MASALAGSAATPMTFSRLRRVSREAEASRCSSQGATGWPFLSRKWLRISPTAPCIFSRVKSCLVRMPFWMLVASSAILPTPITLMADSGRMRRISRTAGSRKRASRSSLLESTRGAGMR